MHSNGTSIAFSDVVGMTSPTVLTNVSLFTGNRSKWSVHNRKDVSTPHRKKTIGVRDPGEMGVTKEYDKATHATLEALHILANSDAGKKYWQVTYPDGGKTEPTRAAITEFGPPEFNDDSVLETSFMLTITDADDDDFLTA
jgi:hypothetical protein